MNADADASANAEMLMQRFPNALLSIYWGPLTLLNFQMAASEPLKIRPSCMSFFMIFTVVKILAKFGTTRKILDQETIIFDRSFSW